MEVVRKIVDGSLLNKIIALPLIFQETKVEITIKPIAQSQYLQLMSRNQLRALLHDSDTEVLSGAISVDMDVRLDELQEERRAKYERFD